MIGLSNVSRRDYEALLRDGESDVKTITDRYGVGWMFRLQGVLCAMTVRQCARDASAQGIRYDSAEGLMALVETFRYDTIFEDNEMEGIKPGPATLKAMLYSMCEAETGDYGGECRCPTIS